MKKVYLALTLLAAIALSGLSSCMLNCVHGSGHEVSEDRKVGDFNRISVAGNYKVTLKQDSSMSLKITGDDNLLKYIKTEVHGGKLRIYSKRNLCTNGQMTLDIGVRNLDEIKASGAVEIVADGKMHTQDLHFDLSGISKVTMDLTAANVTTSGSGSSELNLKGQATSHDIEISGVGHVYAFDFVVGSCNIQTSGVGHCEVNVLNSLSVHSSGASEVRYKGNPSNITNDKSGASSVEKVD
jgi:hypothetical protein